MSQPRTIRDLEITNRQVLLRVDFNVPLNQSGAITNDRRIRAAIPTIEHCLEQKASLVLMSHLGRPGGTFKAEYSLRPLVAALEGLLNGVSVRFVDDFQALFGFEARSAAARSRENQQVDQMILLENLRFHPEEKAGDEAFAQKLAGLGDVYVNDAFATCHRQHASMFAVPQLFRKEDKAVGFLVERELKSLDSLLDDPQRPLVAILGGAKVADKINVVASLLDRVDKILIGGAMAYTFLSASEHDVGESIVDAESLDLARQLLERGGDKLMLPCDHIISDQRGGSGETGEPASQPHVEMSDGGIPQGWQGMDIGPRTIYEFKEVIKSAATVVWNGPLGKFEQSPFQEGTNAIAQALATSSTKTIVGGGETTQAIDQLGLADKIDHISTGGGAFLKYLQDRQLPALDALLHSPQGTPDLQHAREF